MMTTMPAISGVVMANRLRFVVLVVLCTMGACAGAQAGPPSYLLLRQAETPAAGNHPVHPARVPHVVHAQSYAYGWFGACPREHAQRHFGYYRTYTQWS